MLPVELPNISKATESEDEASAEDPDDLVTGKAFLQADQPEKALDHFARFAKLNPESPQGFFFLGTAFSELDQTTEAITALKKAIELANARGFDSAQFHVNLGNCFLQCSKVDEAIRQFRVAEEIMPDEPRAHLNMARACLEKNNPVYAELALAELTKAEAEKSESPLVPLLKARGLELLGKPERAAVELRHYATAYVDKSGKAEDSKRVDRLIANLRPRKTTHNGPIAPGERHYDIHPGDMYIVYDLDEVKGLVTLATGDSHDPDGGTQDGENDGYITMPLKEFMSQVKNGTIYRRDDKDREAHVETE